MDMDSTPQTQPGQAAAPQADEAELSEQQLDHVAGGHIVRTSDPQEGGE